MMKPSSKVSLMIYIIFFASGISGLIYEVVWLRMLSRIIGVTTYATATVLAAFMAGLALGSFLFGRFIDRRQNPLRIYAFLEAAVAVAALSVPVIFALSLPLFKYVYQTSGESLAWTTAARAIVTFLALLLPTTLMGGTLPILTSWRVRREALFGRSFALLYGINTFGAVAGVCLSGFITIGAFGERRTILIGVLINILVAAIAYTLAGKEEAPAAAPAGPVNRPAADTGAISPYGAPIRRVVLTAFALSGFTALAYEVIWTRQLILFLQTSIYAFSGMLAVFLCGIAAGSLFMKNMVDRYTRPLVIFGVLELLVGLLSIINLYLFPFFDGQFATALLPYPSLWALVAIVLPITFIFGMIFPTAAVCYAPNLDKTGHAVGRLYSANTLGSILGSLLAGFWLIPLWGSTASVVLLAWINFGLGLLLLALEQEKSPWKKWSYWALAPLFILLALWVRGQDPFLATIAQRVVREQGAVTPGATGLSHIYYHQEGIEGTVTAFSVKNLKRLWINGIGMTYLGAETKLMAHLPLMYARAPRELLVICFGMGSTLRSASLYPDLQVTAVELVPELYQTFKYYHADAAKILAQKNVHPVVNDGRNYLLWSSKKFDVITVDPAPPIWSAGTVNLYSREFFELCREHLTPTGVMCLWFPGDTTEDEMKSVLKTFQTIFPQTAVYHGPNQWGYYFLGLMAPVPDRELEQSMGRAFQNPLIVKDLGEFEQTCITPEQLHRLLAALPPEVGSLSRGGVLITDDYPYTEFFLWRYLLTGKK